MSSFSLEVPTPGLSLGSGQSFFAVSPDGSLLAMRTIENDEPVLSVRRLDQFDNKVLRGTVSGSWPFWSPDNRFIGYFVNSRLQVSPADGGPPQVVPGVTTAINLTQGAWNAEGVILSQRGHCRLRCVGRRPAVPDGEGRGRPGVFETGAQLQRRAHRDRASPALITGLVSMTIGRHPRRDRHQSR